jgi:hypothetical protein
MSVRPGIRYFPEALTMRAPEGISMEESGPTAEILSASIRTVEFGFGGAPVASITVAWMMAMVAGWGLEQAAVKRRKSRGNANTGRMGLGTFVL